MSELTIASFTAFLGITVLVIGKIVESALIEPVKFLHKVRGETIFAVTFYANVGSHSNEEELNEARKHLRSLSGQMRQAILSIPMYWLLSFVRAVPPKKDMVQVAYNLIGMSNQLIHDHSESQDELRKLLQIP